MAQRMFVAAWAHEVAEQAERLQKRLARAGAKVSWSNPRQLHLTLKFLGETPLLRTAAICKALERVAGDHAPMDLLLQGPGAFPDARRPRTLWVGVRDGAEPLEQLHLAVDQAMADLGYSPERRFHPHLTLGRVRSGDNLADLAALLERDAEFELGRVEVAEVALVASQLTTDGPVYEVIGRATLGQGAAPPH